MAYGQYRVKRSKWVQISRSVYIKNTEWNYHVTKYLKPKCDRLYGYICATLSSHLDINRVEFGSTLWNSVVVPALTHGCSIWFNDYLSLTYKINSMQYKCAKAVMKLNCNPARGALLGDLGWLPLTYIMDNIRVKYLVRLKTEVPHSRLLYKVAKSLLENKTNVSYIKSIRNIVNDRGYDFIVNGEIPNSKQVLQNFKKTGREMYHNAFLDDIR